MGDRGANLLNAVRVMEAFGAEIEAFRDELQDLLVGADKAASVAFEEENDSTDDDPYYDQHGWVCRGWRWTFPAKDRRSGPGKRRSAGALSVALDLGRPGGPALTLGFPCLLVAWSKPNDWEKDLDAGDGFWPRSDQKEELRAGRLFWWLKNPDEGEGDADAAERRKAAPKDAAWLYLLPLVAVSSAAKLRSLIVEPVLLLLEGRPADGAFAAAPEVLRFGWESGRSVLDEG